MKHHFANCRQDLIVQKQAWEAFIVKPTAGVHSVGTIFMTKILPNEQTLQLSSDGANKIQMHAIKGNNLCVLFYHRGSELSSDTRPCRVILRFGESAWVQLTSHTHATAVIHVRLPRLCSTCSWVRPKPPRVNPRNAGTCHRINSEGLSKNNHALIQQATLNTHVATAQHKMNGLLGRTPKGEGDEMLDHCLV